LDHFRLPKLEQANTANRRSQLTRSGIRTKTTQTMKTARTRTTTRTRTRTRMRRMRTAAIRTRMANLPSEQSARSQRRTRTRTSKWRTRPLARSQRSARSPARSRAVRKAAAKAESGSIKTVRHLIVAHFPHQQCSVMLKAMEVNPPQGKRTWEKALKRYIKLANLNPEVR